MRDNSNSSSKIIERYINTEKWNKARYFIKKALKKEPKNHWLLTRLALTYYEQCSYKKSIRIVRRALKLAPHCPLVLWDYAGTLDMLNYSKEALNIYRKLIKRDIKSLAYGECGEGMRWAKSLLNDCLYRIALCYKDIGNRREKGSE